MRTPEEIQRDRDDVLNALTSAGRSLNTVEVICHVYAVDDSTGGWWPYYRTALADLRYLASTGRVIAAGREAPWAVWSLTSREFASHIVNGIVHGVAGSTSHSGRVASAR